MYAKYLNRNKYEIHYCCFDQHFPKVQLENTSVDYVLLEKNRLKSYIRFCYQSWKYIRRNKFDLVFLIDSKFALIFRLINLLQPFSYDIRTGDLSDNKFTLWRKNLEIWFCSLFFRYITVISKSLADRLRLSNKKTTVLPLGGELFEIQPKTFNEINLLYIGSLDSRNMHETIYGLAQYIENNNSNIKITYDIIGFGNEATTQSLNDSIQKTNLQEYVTFHGRKKIDELIPFLIKCNVGVVYVPQTYGYDCQPVTKLYESLLAGMPVIATNTFENRTSLSVNCGVIIEDNPESFAKGISLMISHKNLYNSHIIKSKYISFEWQNIVKNILEPYFDFILREK